MRVLITRPRNKTADFAAALDLIGAEPVYLPCIEIKPVPDTTLLDRALNQLHCYDWLIFTSANAVEAVWKRMAALGVKSLPQDLHLAAVGPKTADCLQAHGLYPDFVPSEYTSARILPGLGSLNKRWVLLPSADIADDHLPRAIQTMDGVAHVITAYKTLPPEPDSQGLAELRQGVDVITFTSGSTVRNFVSLVRDAGLEPFTLPGKPRIACIGPKTADAARETGFKVDIMAKEYTVDGLVKAIAHINQELQ
jgi:uroporphyrinogen-III synthase